LAWLIGAIWLVARAAKGIRAIETLGRLAAERIKAAILLRNV
jgi:hypothetical protein